MIKHINLCRSALAALVLTITLPLLTQPAHAELTYEEEKAVETFAENMVREEAIKRDYEERSYNRKQLSSSSGSGSSAVLLVLFLLAFVGFVYGVNKWVAKNKENRF